MKRFLIPAVMLCSLSFSSCATIFCGTKAQVTFESNVSEATLTIDGRKHKNVTFPYTTDVERGFNETIVKAEAEGYETTMVYVDKVLNPVSIINLTDVLGWAIDVATGAVTKPEHKIYEIELMKLKPIEE